MIQYLLVLFFFSAVAFAQTQATVNKATPGPPKITDSDKNRAYAAQHELDEVRVKQATLDTQYSQLTLNTQTELHQKQAALGAILADLSKKAGCSITDLKFECPKPEPSKPEPKK